MKVKLDFVTNSSSTAYVVFIPNNFKIDKEETLKFLPIDDDWTEEEYNSKLDEFHELIDMLKNGEDLWTYGGDGTDGELYSALLDLCGHYKFILSGCEMNGEGNNTILSVKEKDVQNILFKYIDLDKLFKTMDNKGDKICLETKKDIP